MSTHAAGTFEIESWDELSVPLSFLTPRGDVPLAPAAPLPERMADGLIRLRTELQRRKEPGEVSAHADGRVIVVELPAGQDPDDVVRDGGRTVVIPHARVRRMFSATR